mmetsp:Transcript_1001/g.2394  ORF Transcript_1001/g.2394 Transcript_1001/m.2394 type:complete len:318 (-) Transcript_1001:112-1065(-)|eukprot:CAMPEP_0177664984 /NCGR_PEP_ID=MMETSP0447-20121125/20805_1 /TAXON_ID=0 /ORGANISM="Stygamoeba regulata, Strain BSH-02190019" /LENGTH=317 /DNA_ID=CAMNT_0019171033 /DNA_START=481 /DNA_END=1434 /DNA_ORIENTATION=+
MIVFLDGDLPPPADPFEQRAQGDHSDGAHSEDESGGRLAAQLVTPGEVIAESGFLRGHGSYIKNERLVASVSGVVERVNRLISVRPLKARYHGEVGDVIVGRIRAVGSKRWRVDVNGRQDAILMLSAINLPGGVQRRRTASDVLQMRTFYQENDLISAEVQQFFNDGAMAIHTRSLKYGKLAYGQFQSVPWSLIRRTKSAFVSLPNKVQLILGANGYIFISLAPAEVVDTNGTDPDEPSTYAQPRSVLPVTLDDRMRVARVHMAVQALAAMYVSIWEDTVWDVVCASEQAGLPVHAMLTLPSLHAITEKARNRARNV